MKYYFISYQKYEYEEDYHHHIQNIVVNVHPMKWLKDQFDRISYRDEDVRIISYYEIEKEHYELLQDNISY